MNFFDFLYNKLSIAFGKNFYYTNFSNYVIIFKVDAEMSVIFAEFPRQKSLKKFTH